jgi:hypothetical protein
MEYFYFVSSFKNNLEVWRQNEGVYSVSLQSKNKIGL